MSNTIISITCVSIGFVLGVIYSNWDKHNRNMKKRHRRSLIIAMKDSIFNDIYRWNMDHHEAKALNPAKGLTIFKGNANLMTEEEFARAVRMKK